MMGIMVRGNFTIRQSNILCQSQSIGTNRWISPEKKGYYSTTRKKNKSEQKEELLRVIQQIIENKMEIKGAYAKPTVYDILWIQLILFPYTLAKYIFWYVLWVWRHDILRQLYDDVEKLYMMRKLMKMGQYQFDQFEDEKRAEFLRRELWVKRNFTAWKVQEEENMKKQLAENTKYKQYRRYVKNHGIGRMTFDDS